MEISLLNALQCRVEKGQFGPCIRLSRGDRWIIFTPLQWQKIVESLVHNDDSFVKLSDNKQARKVIFKGYRYVSFLHTNKGYNNFFNLNYDEWTMLKDKLPDITQALPKCLLCKDMKVKKQLHDHRMLETKLSAKQLEDVKDNNQYAYNQLAYQCEYCGDSFDYGSCHCHRYDCRQCEPDNFCKKCQTLLVESL